MPPRPPGLENYSDEDMKRFAKMLQDGEVPPELNGLMAGID